MESRKTTLGARLEDYLSERGYPAEYDMEDLCEICAVGREPLLRPALEDPSVASLRSFEHAPAVPPALSGLRKILCELASRRL